MYAMLADASTEARETTSDAAPDPVKKATVDPFDKLKVSLQQIENNADRWVLISFLW
jgi:hypothetical protein